MTSKRPYDTGRQLLGICAPPMEPGGNQRQHDPEKQSPSRASRLRSRSVHDSIVLQKPLT